jgi:hypothetical protein
MRPKNRCSCLTSLQGKGLCGLHVAGERPDAPGVHLVFQEVAAAKVHLVGLICRMFPAGRATKLTEMVQVFLQSPAGDQMVI